MKSFKEYVDYSETACLLDDSGIDPGSFAEWAIQNKDEFLEGIAGSLAGWGARKLGQGAAAMGNLALQGGKWGAQQAGNAAAKSAVYGADQAMRGVQASGRQVQQMGDRYQKWRDPISRVDNANKAIDQIIAAYGDHAVNGGLSVSRILSKTKNVLANLRQSIETEKASGMTPAPGVA